MKLESRVRLDNAPTTCCGNRCRSALWRQSESLTNLNDFHASRITVFLNNAGSLEEAQEWPIIPIR